MKWVRNHLILSVRKWITNINQGKETKTLRKEKFRECVDPSICEKFGSIRSHKYGIYQGEISSTNAVESCLNHRRIQPKPSKSIPKSLKWLPQAIPKTFLERPWVPNGQGLRNFLLFGAPRPDEIDSQCTLGSFVGPFPRFFNIKYLDLKPFGLPF